MWVRYSTRRLKYSSIRVEVTYEVMNHLAVKCVFIEYDVASMLSNLSLLVLDTTNVKASK